MMQPLADQTARERAARAADVNIVVTAGAGTGKTTLLIDRLTHLLFRLPNRVSLNHIVALTFTNKAANEMKLRLRQRLLVMKEVGRGQASEQEAFSYEAKVLRELQSLYGLSDQQVGAVAEHTLFELERAHIETIHSFAAYLLRLFPVEAGVDPSFQEDEGTQFEAHFQLEWSRWLEQELEKDGPHRDCWCAILQSVSLDDLKILARTLMGDLVPLNNFFHRQSLESLPDGIRNWLKRLLETARALRQAHPKDQKLETMLDAAIGHLEKISRGTHQEKIEGEPELNWAIPDQTKSWSDEEYEQARSILKVVCASRSPFPTSLSEFLDILLPFVKHCRETFLKAGWVSFDGLLVKARDLLRDLPRVRREIKQQFQAILVDEFQDTDPVQYELMLYLAEQSKQEAQSWSQVRLEPGKLFIVGDPKQSIYAFRRADIEAYDSVIDDCILGQRPYGEQLTLSTNFRSHAGILNPVNHWCRQWFPPNGLKGIQPQYENLLPVETESIPCPEEGVQVRLVRSFEDVVDAEAATRAEAQELARWLAEEVIDQQQLLLHQECIPIRPRDVAILFRTLTNLRVYVEALRQYGIPYVTEGEKHFFERPEIVDCINLLRVLADPYDRTAVVGVLRSPIGGCSDDVVAYLLRAGYLDDWHRRSLPPDVPTIFGFLQGLRDEVLSQPVPDALDRVFQGTPFLELTAASLDGEQAVANVKKLQEMAEKLAIQLGMGFRGVVHKLTQWIHEPPPEAERSLVEDDPDALQSMGAMRLMSIHKAKGLEFPMVILAGLHRGADPKNKSISVDHDWLSNILGLRLGPYYSLGGVYLETKMAIRQRAEQIRLLYVAMTRAQRRLVLSGGWPTTAGAMPRGLLGTIMNGLGMNRELLANIHQDSLHHRLSVGGTQVSLDIVTASKGIGPSHQQKTKPWRNVDSDTVETHPLWNQRRDRMIAAYERSLFVTPTEMGTREFPSTSRDEEELRISTLSQVQPSDSAPSHDQQMLLGKLAHRVLETWNFHDDPEKLPAWIGEVCTREIPKKWQNQTQDLVDELRKVFNAFVRTAPYAILHQGEILGREVPIIVPWQGKDSSGSISANGYPAVLHGIADVVYRWKGHIYVADYKTNAVDHDSIKQIVENYRGQAIAYREALRPIFKDSPIRAHLIFLRTGASIEVGGASNE